MTELQLPLSIGIPSVLVILAWFSNNSRLSTLDKRVDGVDSHIDRLSTRVDVQADAHHRDMLQILQAITSLHERVAVVESKQQ